MQCKAKQSKAKQSKAKQSNIKRYRERCMENKNIGCPPTLS
jgi:uncharacterized protein YdeI (YjbR/CyaY-like superfamily)